MEETFKLIGHVTSLIPYKDSSRPHRLAVVEAKSRKDAAAAERRLLSGLSCPSVCPRQQNCNIGFRDIGLNAPAAVAASRPPLRRRRHTESMPPQLTFFLLAYVTNIGYISPSAIFYINSV